MELFWVIVTKKDQKSTELQFSVNALRYSTKRTGIGREIESSLGFGLVRRLTRPVPSAGSPKIDLVNEGCALTAVLGPQ